MKFKKELVFFFLSLMKICCGFEFLVSKVNHACNKTLFTFPNENTNRYNIVLKSFNSASSLNWNVMFSIKDGKTVVYSYNNKTRMTRKKYFLRLWISDNFLAVTTKIKLQVRFVTYIKNTNYVKKGKKGRITIIKMKQSNITLADLTSNNCSDWKIPILPVNMCKCLNVSNINVLSFYEYQLSFRGCFLNEILFLKPENVKLILKSKGELRYSSQGLEDKITKNVTRHKRSAKKKNYAKYKRSQAKYLNFKQLVYKTSILENKPVRTYVFRIHVLDHTGKSPLNVKYTMTALKNRKSNYMFLLNPSTGVITTLVPLDRELMASHTFNIFATSNDQSVGQASSKLIITVLDINDNKPVFSQYPYVESIKENIPNGSYVLKVSYINTSLTN